MKKILFFERTYFKRDTSKKFFLREREREREREKTFLKTLWRTFLKQI